jgi:hypothetical protein
MLVVVTVALVMAAMMAVTASSAFAQVIPMHYTCGSNPGYVLVQESLHPCGIARVG